MPTSDTTRILGDLVINPAVGLFHAVTKAGAGLPAEVLPKKRVVAVATVDTLGRLQIVNALELGAGDLFNDVHQLVDGHQFAAPQVDRLEDFAVHDRLRAFEAIVDVHEAARLLA